MQIPAIQLDTILDPAIRQTMAQVLKLIELVSAANQTLRSENQPLRDENARLNGGSGKPARPPALPPPADHASAAERRSNPPRRKGPKNHRLVVTREPPCVVDPATLPPGAVRQGTSEVMVPDVIVQAAGIRCVRAVWWVPRTGQTRTAPLPSG